MISIFIMYSTDRQDALLATISCLQDMPLYDQCQKILVVDETTDYIPEGWLITRVVRKNGFCWADMWNAGVRNSSNDVVLYLDSDRLWPKCFLEKIMEHIKDDAFLFTSRHFLMMKPLEIGACKEFLETFPRTLSQPPFLGNLQLDLRYKNPIHGPGKNVMSGGTAFTKSTYLRLGGVDPWYCGHGAYADTDFHYKAHLEGCRFIDLKLPELHWPHSKSVNGAALDQEQLARLALDNYWHYCKKWNIPTTWAKRLERSPRNSGK